ncbi:hypothetical protein CB1_001748001 [Camelus ferus]|nr:hypothetical protein CB1_001748001 [Camelus ferus]
MRGSWWSHDETSECPDECPTPIRQLLQRKGNEFSEKNGGNRSTVHFVPVKCMIESDVTGAMNTEKCDEPLVSGLPHVAFSSSSSMSGSYSPGYAKINKRGGYTMEVNDGQHAWRARLGRVIALIIFCFLLAEGELPWWLSEYSDRALLSRVPDPSLCSTVPTPGSQSLPDQVVSLPFVRKLLP